MIVCQPVSSNGPIASPTLLIPDFKVSQPLAIAPGIPVTKLTAVSLRVVHPASSSDPIVSPIPEIPRFNNSQPLDSAFGIELTAFVAAPRIFSQLPDQSPWIRFIMNLIAFLMPFRAPLTTPEIMPHTFDNFSWIASQEIAQSEPINFKNALTTPQIVEPKLLIVDLIDFQVPETMPLAASQHPDQSPRNTDTNIFTMPDIMFNVDARKSAMY